MAHSNTESKYRFLTQASIEIIWLQQLFQELGIELTRHSVLWCDNVSVGSLASNLVFHARIKRKIWMYTSLEKNFSTRNWMLGTSPQSNK